MSRPTISAWIAFGIFLSVPISGAWCLEYPIQAGTHVIFETTTASVNAPARGWRYELWVLGERPPGYEAIWTFHSNVGTPDETVGGAIPLTITKSGAKQFPRQRRATYILEEAIETFMPDLSGVTGFTGTWRGPPVVTGRYHSYQVIGTEGNLVRCSFAKYGLNKMDQVTGSLVSGEAFFDPAGNWMRRMYMATQMQTPQGPVLTSEARIRLDKVVQRDANWITSRREDFLAFQSVLNTHDQELLKANDNLSSATIAVAPLFGLWQNYFTNHSTSYFYPLAKNHFDVMRAELPTLGAFWQKRRAVVGGGAPPWTMQDTQGQSFSLQSLGGRPILLYFWSMGNWDALMGMRQLREFKKAYEGRGLLILPVNMDGNSQAVNQALGLLEVELPSLMLTDSNLLTLYGIPIGLVPSSVLIGSDRKVVDVRYGWGLQIFDALQERIEAVLPSG